MTPLVQKSLRVVFLTLASTLLAALAVAQTTTHPIPPCKALTAQPKPLPTHKPTPCRTGLHPETSISLGAFPQLTATRVVSAPYAFSTASMSPSAGVLGTIRQSFSPWLGYSLNMGYTRASERGTYNAGFESMGTPSNLIIPANMYELSLSYLAERHVTPRLAAFADVGAGMLTFLPEHRGDNAIDWVPYRALVPSVCFRPLGVGGIGIDYRLTHRLALRAEYRGQIYKFADYGNALPRYLTVTSEPTFSVVYTFTHPR
jgi:hypothetical protein